MEKRIHNYVVYIHQYTFVYVYTYTLFYIDLYRIWDKTSNGSRCYKLMEWPLHSENGFIYTSLTVNYHLPSNRAFGRRFMSQDTGEDSCLKRRGGMSDSNRGHKLR